MQLIVTQGYGLYQKIVPQGYGGDGPGEGGQSSVGGSVKITEALGTARASGVAGEGHIILVEYRSEGHVEED